VIEGTKYLLVRVFNPLSDEKQIQKTDLPPSATSKKSGFGNIVPLREIEARRS
jgi:hypothetical protein